LIAALRGPAIYQQASFLLDQVGAGILPDWVDLIEDPLLPRGLASAPFDAEGVATGHRALISNGILQGYVLDSYAARRLGLETTGNAGGVRNLQVTQGDMDLAALCRQMHRGLLVTELMGEGANIVTGDYSRGASGLWIENGEIAFPVEEITVAGTLQQMFRDLLAIGSDTYAASSIRTGSWLLGEMTVAGD
jgi:PmbA protein